MRLGAALEFHAISKPDQEALIFNDRRLTWREVNAGANRAGHAFLRLGAQRGDRVLLVMANSVAFVEAYYGLAKIGCISAPVMSSLTGADIAFILNTLRARFVLIDAASADLWRSIADQVPTVEAVIGVGEGHGLDHDFDDMTRDAPHHNPDIPVDPFDDVTVKFTSGTTGVPKGCVRTHYNFTMAALSSLTEMPVYDDDIGLVAQPLAAGMALSFLTMYFFKGVTVVMLPHFDAGLYLDAIEQEKITHATSMDWMARRFCAHPSFLQRDLSGVRIMHGINFLETLPPILAQGTFKGGFTAGYASSEAGGLISSKTPAEFARVIADPGFRGGHSSGRPARLFQVECLDDDLRPVPTGEVGELAIRGPSVFRGYWERPEETEKVLRDGWLTTGDLAVKDESGYVYLRGRKRDMIRTGAMNVYPAEIEPIIQQYPGVREVAVVGLPDPEWGERVVAAVVADETCTSLDILTYCRDKLAPHKRPKAVEFFDRFPLTASGKIIKKDVVDILLARGVS